MYDEMQVILDHREGKLKEFFQNSKYEITYQNLPQGDLQILHLDKVLAVFERKTLADLESSIVDGRYRNQKKALLETFPATSVFYIIEGNGPKSPHVTGAIINTQLRDKIGVFKTDSVSDTYQLLCEIIDRIAKDPEKYTTVAPLDTTLKKASNKDPVFVNMLAQIPGVSLVTARAIAGQFPSPFALSQATNLETLKINKRKISKSVVQEIAALFGTR